MLRLFQFLAPYKVQAACSVALASIQSELHGGVSALQWVVGAYALTFAAGIITCAALGDRLGRRRVYVAGLTLFTVASALCAVAPGSGSLIAFRALQGLGAAMLSPAALSILTTTFREGRERNLALGVWGAARHLPTDQARSQTLFSCKFSRT